MKTIGILGSNGTAGRFLVQEALKKGYKVKVLVKDKKKLVYFTHYLHKNVELYEGEVDDKSLLFDFLNGSDLVINCLEHLNYKIGIYEETLQRILNVMEEIGLKHYVGICSSSVKCLDSKKNLIHKIASKVLYNSNPHIMRDKENSRQLLKASDIHWNLYKLPMLTESFIEKKIYSHKNEIKGLFVCSRALSKFIMNNIEKNIYHNKDIFVWT